MRSFRSLLIGVGYSAMWPGYLALVAYAARQAPLPRGIGLILATTLLFLALALLAANLVRRFLRAGGALEIDLEVPPQVLKQVRWAALAVIAGHLLFLLPCWLLANGLITAAGRPVTAPTIVRLLIIAFEVSIFAVAFRLVRSRSATMAWVGLDPQRFRGLARRRRIVALAVLSAIAGIIVLDVRGYSFSARRFSNGAVGSVLVIAVSYAVFRTLRHAIDRHAWRWVKPAAVETEGAGAPPDLIHRLKRLGAYAAAGLGVYLGCRVWDVDLALFKFILEQNLWGLDGGVVVTVADVARASVIVSLAVLAWRHMSTFFAVAVFPRMPDDPGVRFAVVTLCRYAVLAVGLIGGLSAVHLGLEKIGFVLAALGVGLGFGLQEIVSNFVCGIILLLERPIRVGDIVTVSGMTGKVDRINIRATTIINGDNQSIIVPNRAFITGDLVNWTLKDKVIRVTVKVNVAMGADPDRVSDLLLAIARDDPDVLRNPVPSAVVEEFGLSSMVFVLHVHVPDPSLAGRVKHRVFGQILSKFREAGLSIPLPAQELIVKPVDASGHPVSASLEAIRYDRAEPTPPAPKIVAAVTAPAPVEDCHRGVDE